MKAYLQSHHKRLPQSILLVDFLSSQIDVEQKEEPNPFNNNKKHLTPIMESRTETALDSKSHQHTHPSSVTPDRLPAD